MSTVICAIWLLAAIPGAKPPGSAAISEPVMEEASEGEMLVAEPLPANRAPVTIPVVACHGSRRPEPLLYVDTSCSMRWYTMLNGAYHRQPYNYLIEFDYPWHREPRCKRVHPWPKPIFGPHSKLAPLALSGDARRGSYKTFRPSAIRTVD